MNTSSLHEANLPLPEMKTPRVSAESSTPNRSKKFSFIVAIGLLALCLATDFSHVRAHGYMADDWVRLSHHFYQTPHLAKYALPYPLKACLKSARFDGRPLLPVSLLLEWLCFSLGGRLLWAAAGCAILSLNAFLFFLLVRRQLSERLSFVIACATLLFPGDTTHQWLTLACGRLSFTIALLACLSFAKGRRVIPYVLLVCGLLWYEFSVIFFVFAPWAASGGRWRDVWKAFLVLASAGTTWLGVKALMFLVGEGAYSSGTIGSGLHSLLSVSELLEYLTAYPKALVTGFFDWPLEAFQVTIAAGYGGYVIATGTLAGIGYWITSRRNGTEHVTRGRCVAIQGPSRPNTRYGDKDNEFCQLARGTVTGVICVLANAAPAFVMGPTNTWGIYTRANYPMAFGVALATVCFLALTYQASTSRLLKLAVVVIGTIGAFTWITARYEMQRQFVRELKQERREILALVESLGGIPEASTIVVRTVAPAPDRHVVRSIRYAQTWELRCLFRAIYGETVAVITERDLTDRRVPAGKSGAGVCWFDLSTKERKWLIKPPEDANDPAIPNPFVMRYLRVGL